MAIPTNLVRVPTRCHRICPLLLHEALVLPKHGTREEWCRDG